MKEFLKSYKAEIIASILCLLGGMLSGYIADAGDSSWYVSLDKPTFNPPSWIFGPVWTVLYVMMGWGLGIIWKNRFEYKTLLIWFGIEYFFNVSWAPLFFYFHRIDLALLDLFLMWCSLLICMILAWRLRAVFMLLLPYMMWTSFAFVLNFNIYILNAA
ncbi:MAG: tryptophan-rich sensory protein [Candidatus Dependentiae bacterium]|nr:tryptophan-rich sensory protein [Candidatus Dependentiae bacterium]